jgi:ligand-binding SRPBCC domain-containing protein
MSTIAPVFCLETSIWLPLPRRAVFDFFSDARNLERITPAFLAFRIVTTTPVVMRAGRLIDYRIGLHGLPMRWRSEITVWNPPVCFVDVQRRGPYRMWEHTHTFADRDAGTLVGDRVRYALPRPAFAARLINRLVVEPDLRRIFTFRHEALERTLGAPGRASPIEFSREPGGA